MPFVFKSLALALSIAAGFGADKDALPFRPGVVTGPGGIPKVLKTKKNPLGAWEIEGRAFAATMLPPGQSASGFFYFQTTLLHGSTIYLSGLSEAATGRELLY